MPVYLDNNATTRLDPRVLEAMQPFLENVYGNGSSLHRYGRLVRSAIERAREQLAAAVNAHADQIIFTSGGTEANNLIVKGIASRQAPAALLISAIEHPSLREPALATRRYGWRVDEIPVDQQGRVQTPAVGELLGEDTRLVSVMTANNETGAVQPVEEVARVARERGAVMHSDASQALGKWPLDFNRSGVQAMTLSGHKLHGPLGAGALVADRTVVLQSQQLGGEHEAGLRAGTENVAAIVGFAVAAELAVAELDERAGRMRALRDRLEASLREIPDVCIFAGDAERLPNTVQFGVRGCHGETLLLQLDRAGMAVSSGSACHSDVSEPSHVLTAMGVEPELALTAIRVSLSQYTGEEDIDRFASVFASLVNEFRKASVVAANA